MSTTGSGGKTLSKKATVITNDPNNAKIPVTIKGRVIQVYTLEPKSVRLKGVVGETIRGTVRVIPSKAFAFKIKDITAKHGENIRYQYKEIDDRDPIEYAVTVEYTATKVGVYLDTLYLKTDSEIKPQIQLTVISSIREATDSTEAK